jgi:hypothetical protein
LVALKMSGARNRGHSNCFGSWHPADLRKSARWSSLPVFGVRTVALL